ncbi:MAG: prepilin-type N-terminal cleavage/methylation domain-containing protein [Planctomycetales bacterium]|nr:prepilin-type N-terminal cleavage/methylation domain-containing protein [Planctomycetales bacterium]
MPTKLCSCSKHSRRGGLTLIEVLAAITLTSTLLATVVVAHRNHATQIQRTRKIVTAVDLADQLLYSWAAAGMSPPRSGGGQVENADGYRWETEVIQRAAADDILPLEVVELRVYQVEDRTSPLFTLQLATPPVSRDSDLAPTRLAHNDVRAQ